MNLKILLPSQVFAELSNIVRIVAETPDGSFGILPQRLDCIAILSPGILIYENEFASDTYLAVDEGVLIKTGPDVLVSVRHAIVGTDLGQLRDAVEEAFVNLTDQEKSLRQALAKMESGLIKHLATFQYEQ